LPKRPPSPYYEENIAEAEKTAEEAKQIIDEYLRVAFSNALTYLDEGFSIYDALLKVFGEYARLFVSEAEKKAEEAKNIININLDGILNFGEEITKMLIDIFFNPLWEIVTVMYDVFYITEDKILDYLKSYSDAIIKFSATVDP